MRPHIRPKSIREYAANELYARSERIEDVAAQLGVDSLDSAARLIDAAWQREWGDDLRRRGASE